MVSEIPQTQKAIVVEKFGDDYSLKLDNAYPVPEPAEDEVLVRLTSSGVCHSDLSIISDEWKMGNRFDIPGHEGSGYIVKHGAKADTTKYPVGTRVGVSLVWNPCGDCIMCHEVDGEVHCINDTWSGFRRNGTWAQYISIKAKYIIPVPDGPEENKVGPMLCGGVTVYKGLKTANIRAGQWIVILGAGGGLGSMAVQFATSMGYRVIGVDTGSSKEKLAKKLGAEKFVDFKVDDVVEKINEITEGGAHAALVIPPSVAVYNQVPNYLRLNGCLVAIGLPEAEGVFNVPPGILVFKRLRVCGSLIGTRQDNMEALGFLAREKVTPPIQMHKMEDIDDILNSMKRGEISGRAVIKLE